MKVKGVATCRIYGCGKIVWYIKGMLCKPHHMRFWHYGDAEHDPRAHLKATESPKTFDLHWAAGFLEGEAHFGVNGKLGTCSQVVVVTQISKEPLNRCRNLFGGSIRQVRRSEKNPKHSDVWVWQLSGMRARGLMMTMYKMLSNQKQAAVQTALGANK